MELISFDIAQECSLGCGGLTKNPMGYQVRIFRDSWQYRYAIFNLFKRDFVASYRRSMIGWLWLFFSPLISVASWLIMQYSGIIKFSQDGIPYPIYVLFSTLLWQLFLGSFTATNQILTVTGGFIMQVKFPHEILVFKQIANHLATFLISFIVNILVCVILGLQLNGYFLLLPVLMIPILLFSIGLGLIISVFQVVAPEIRTISEMLVGLSFFLTPIVFRESDAQSRLLPMIKLNPLTSLIARPRDLVLTGAAENWHLYFIWVSFVFLFFIGAWIFFKQTEKFVIERIS